MNTPLEILSPDEAALKTACVSAVREGLEGFAKVGRALLEIRESRLYRDTHATFVDFCAAEFGLKKRRAYQLIEAAAVVEESPECEKFCTSESQIREIGKVEPEKRAEVMAKAAESGKVTANSIREAAAGTPDEPKEAEIVQPQDAETRAYQVSLKIQGWIQEMKDHVASLNPSRTELIQAGLAFKKLGADFERSASAMEQLQ